MLKDFLPPHIYKIESQQTYFDPVRKKYVVATERETVRQRVVQWLIQELDVPQRMIRIGEKLFYYGLNFRHRADIVIERYDRAENTSRPVAVVECKALETPLNDAAFNEAFDYAEKLACDYCILTNGEELYCFYLDAENYIELDSVPNYHEMSKAASITRQQSEDATF